MAHERDQTAQKRKWSRRKRAAGWGSTIFALVLLALTTAFFALDSAAGHRWLIIKLEDQINGLNIGTIRGSLYSSFRVEDVSLIDREGRFLSIPALQIRWSPWSLINRRVDIKSVTVERLILKRLPTSQDRTRQKNQAAGPFIPQLPVSIHIGALTIDRIEAELQEGLRPFSLKSAGQLERSGALTLNLELLPLDQTGQERAFIDVVFNPQAQALGLNIDVDAPMQGMLATLTGIDKGFTITASGRGPYDDWHGVADIAIAGENVLNAAVRHAPSNWALQYTISPPQALKAQLGSTIKGQARLRPGNDIVDVEATLESKAAHMSFQGPILLQDGGQFGPDARLTADIADRNNFALTNIALDALLSGQIRAPIAQVTLTFSAADNAPAILTPLLREGGQLQARILYDDRSEPLLNIADATFNATGLQVRGAATYALRNGALQGAFALSLDHVERWDDTLQGGARADVEVNRSGTSSPLALSMDAKATLSSALPALQHILGDGQIVTAEASIGEQAIVITNVKANTINAKTNTGVLDLMANGRLDGAIIKAETAITIGEPTGLDPRLEGPLQINADAQGQVDNPMIAIDARLGTAQLSGTRLEDITVKANGQVKNGIQLNIGALAHGRPLSGKAQLIAGQYWQAQNIEMQFVGWDAKGSLSRSEAGPVTGNLRLMKDETASALFGIDGTIKAEAFFLDDRGTQVIDFNADTTDLRMLVQNTLYDSDSLKAKGRLRLADMGPSLQITAQGKNIESDGLFLPLLRVEAIRDDLATKADITFTSFLPAKAGVNIGAIIEPTTDGSWSVLADIDGELGGAAVTSDAPLDLTITPGQQSLTQSRINIGDGYVEGAYQRGPSHLHLKAKAKDIPLILLKSLDLSLRKTGTFEGRVALTNSADVKRLESDFSLIDLTPRGVMAEQALTLNGQLGITAQNVEFHAQMDTGSGQNLDVSLTTPVTWQSDNSIPALQKDGALSGQLRANADLAPLWALRGDEGNVVEGQITGDITVSGTPQTPLLHGQIAFNEGRYENREIGLIFTDTTARIALDGRRIALEDFAAQDGNGGTLTGDGDLLLDPKAGFPGQITLNASNFWAIRRDDLRAKTNGTVQAKLAKSGVDIAGDLELARAQVILKDTNSASIPTIDYVEINAPANITSASVEDAGRAMPVSLDVDIRAPRRLFVEGLGLNSEWSADLAINGPVQKAEITGEARLIRGELDFAGKRFNLERGILSFLGGEKIDPRLDILAENTQSDLTARIAVGGVASKPQLSLSSTPTLPEDEILSRILFGASVSDLSPLEAVQLASAIASLSSGGGGLNILGTARRGLGIDRLSVGTETSQTAITGGKYLTDDVYLEITSDPTSGQTDASVEWSITRRLSIISRLGADRDTNMAVRWSRDY